MDCAKTGTLIRYLRIEKGLTQRQLAEKMNISDKTVSKWERGLGCPDVSLLRELAEVLGVDAAKMLSGDLQPNAADSGNLRRVRFYVCPTCGNILTSTGAAGATCCGRRLAPLAARPCDAQHEVCVTENDGEFYLTFSHEMSRGHYLSFVASVTEGRMMFVKLYPEQGGELRMPLLRGGKFYVYCTRHGLMSFSAPTGRPRA